MDEGQEFREEGNTQGRSTCSVDCDPKTAELNNSGFDIAQIVNFQPLMRLSSPPGPDSTHIPVNHHTSFAAVSSSRGRGPTTGQTANHAPRKATGASHVRALKKTHDRTSAPAVPHGRARKGVARRDRRRRRRRPCIYSSSAARAARISSFFAATLSLRWS